MSEDQDLRERFASLRHEEAARSPTFERVLRRIRPAQGSLRTFMAAASFVAVLGIAALLWLLPRRAPRPEVMAAAISQWRAPTDFLLNTPGMDLLRTIPRMVEPADGNPDLPGPNLKPAVPAKMEHRS